ncbi:MAG: hypothetical protein WB791_08670 [Waddliaceae bacterium]
MFYLSRFLHAISPILIAVLLAAGCCRYPRYTPVRIFRVEDFLFEEPVFFLPTVTYSPQKQPKPPKKIPEKKPPSPEKKAPKEEEKKPAIQPKTLARRPYTISSNGLVVPYIDLCAQSEKECEDTFDWGSITPWLFKDRKK